MKPLLIFLCLLTACLLQAQTLFKVKTGCAVDNAEMGKDHYVFEPSKEAKCIVQIIMDANFLPPNFAIKSGDVDNAVATFDNGERFIIYSTSYIERIKTSGGGDWAALFVFAHEIGHHLSNHRFDLADSVRKKEQELQADLYAGSILYRLGATLNEAQGGLLFSCREEESSTHPPRNARLEAVASGWKKAKEQSPTQPGRINSLIEKCGLSPQIDNMLFISGGTFMMGSNDGEADEQPAHLVTVSDFYLSKYEVTVAEFRAFIKDTGYKTDAEKDGKSYGYDGTKWRDIVDRNWQHDPEGKIAPDNYPVINVSWNDASAYCNWMSKKSGKIYRLPTEAEWEYAAGNGSRHTKYSWGNGDPSGKSGGNVSDKTAKKKFTNWVVFENYDDGFVFTAPVGLFNSNDFSLFDMSGNLWEWCSDWYDLEYYKNSPDLNPTGPADGFYRVVHGGSGGSYPEECRVASRSKFSPNFHGNGIGFRVAGTK